MIKGTVTVNYTLLPQAKHVVASPACAARVEYELIPKAGEATLVCDVFFDEATLSGNNGFMNKRFFIHHKHASPGQPILWRGFENVAHDDEYQLLCLIEIEINKSLVSR
ncbi:hypothetical protein LX64_02501 [Chitinophaga skermanii]|uniref:Uncharacterized protein n=1 Tax=Chitinophaga skermanii TaxID=331697 RepID=A0A327QNS2_9BACT|nr:hypothetical protein [Chitinophaga skermanii]RAJ05344.1 hypothetical protein LX64_02501 [Chitinophaga skermanii]